MTMFGHTAVDRRFIDETVFVNARTKRHKHHEQILFQSLFILTNRDELSFFTVFALPNASKIGFACRSCCSSSP